MMFNNIMLVYVCLCMFMNVYLFLFMWYVLPKWLPQLLKPFLPRLPWCVPPLLLPSCLPPRSMEFVEFSLWCSLDLPGSEAVYISPFSCMNLIWSIYIFHHFPIWIYMIYMFLVFPSLQHLAAFTSAMLRPRPHQSARIEWPWEAPASAVPGWVLPHNSWDIIMISSWYHEPRKGSI